MQRAESPNSEVNLVLVAPLLLTSAWLLANISAVKWLLSSAAEISTVYKILTVVVIVALTVRSIGNRTCAKFSFETLSATVDVGCRYFVDRPRVDN